MDPATMMALASLASGVIGSLTGKKEKHGSTYNKEQLGGLHDIMQQIKGMKGQQDITQNPEYQQGQEWLQSMFNDPEFFKNFEAPLQRQFQEQTVPDLANRFASMGSGGALGSTGFRNQLAREGSNLETNIANLRGGMQQNAIPQLQSYAQQPFSNMMQMYQQALQPTQNQYQGPTQGWTGQFAAPLMSAASNIWGQQYGQQAGQQGMGRFPGQSASTF